MNVTLPRRGLRGLLAAAAAFVALCGPLAAPAASAAEELNPWAQRLAPTDTDRVIVKLKAGSRASALSADVAATGDELAALAGRTGVALAASRNVWDDVHVVRVDGVMSVGGLQQAVQKLRADPGVAWAEADTRVHAHRLPNDQFFSGTPGLAGQTGQWYMQSVVNTPAGPTTSATNAVSAWDVTTGTRGVVVAILDTGVRFEHPDLGRADSGGRLLPGYDFVSSDSNGGTLVANDGDGWDPDPSDPGDWISSTDLQNATFKDCGDGPNKDQPTNSSWHGTRVSGIVGALSNNGSGVAGFGWNTWLLPVRVLGKCGGYSSDIIAGMRWAAGLTVSGVPNNPYPAKIINLSLGGTNNCSVSYQQAVTDLAAQGALVVASAGNEGTMVDAPANCQGAAAVAAVRHVGTKVGFSNLGPEVAISSPGGNCVNTGAGSPCLFSIDTTVNLGTTGPGSSDYTNQSRPNVGTSFSAPIVSGIASLMYSVNGNLTPAQTIARLRASARAFPVVPVDDTGVAIPVCRVPTSRTDVQTIQCNCTTSTCGAGLADAAAAVQAALRPIAAVALPPAAAAGQQITLSASGSAAACNKAISSFAWTVVSGSAALSSVNSSTTSLAVPTTTTVVRVTVTDNEGRTDFADVTVSPGGVSSAAPANAGSTACLTAITVPQRVSVPNVVGQSQSAASTAITAAGLTVGAVTSETSTTVAAGSVISQTPAAGTSVASGSTVALVVSSGPPPTTTPSSSGGGGGGGGGGGAMDAPTLTVGALLALGALWGRRRREVARRAGGDARRPRA